MSLKLIAGKWGKNFQKDRCKSQKTGCEFCASLNHKYIILDSENINSKFKISNNMCDCVFVEERNVLYVGVIEIKGSSYSISHVRLQLMGGITLAKHILQKSGCRHYEIFPILVAKNFRDRIKAEELKKHPIVVDKKKMRILLATCGKCFSDVVPEAWV